MSTSTKSPKATTIAIHSLSFLLGALHVFLAIVALTPMISADYHRETKLNYSAFAKSLLRLYQFSDHVTVAYYLRILISSAQFVFAGLLLESGTFVSYDKFGNFGLIGVDLIVLLFQLSVSTSYERLAPTIVFLILLVSRLVIVEQGTKRVRPGVKTRNAGKPKTSTPKKNKNE